MRILGGSFGFPSETEKPDTSIEYPAFLFR